MLYQSIWFGKVFRNLYGKFMKRKVIFLILLIFFTYFSRAQTIIGNIKDIKNAPIEFANIMLLNATDSTYIMGAVSDTEGKFHIELPSDKNYSTTILKVSCLGYKTVFMKPQSRLMEILLHEDARTLNEIVIKGNVPAFKLTQEGVSVNIMGTALANLGTGMDVLSHMPGVFKGENGLEVIGKGTPLIYINGRKVFNPTEIEILNSENIKSIEVITEPGAKYDSETNAVIKIHTKHPIGDGFGISLNSKYWQGRYPFFAEQVQWNFRKGRFDIFGNHLLKKYHYFREANHSTTTKSDTLWKQIYQEVSTYFDYSFLNNIGFNYQFNKTSSLGAKYSIWLYPETNGGDMVFTEAFANEKLYDKLTTRSTDANHNLPLHQTNLYYNGRIGKATIAFDFDYLHSRKESKTDYDEQSAYLDSRTFESKNIVRNNLFAIKLTADFKALAADITLGSELTSSEQDNIYTNSKGYVESSESTVREKHLSPFSEIKWNLPVFSLAVGLRYEYVWSNYSSNGRQSDEQSRNYGNFFPNVSLNTSVGKTQLRLSYSTKTNRPSYWQLRSNVNYGNRYNYQSGNPLLRQEIQHNVALNSVWKFLQFGADYKDRRNAIIYWTNIYNNSGSITYTTFRNINSLKHVYFMVAAAPQIGIWNPRLNFYIDKQWLYINENEEKITMNKPWISFSFTNSLRFKKDWTLFADLYFRSKGDDENIYYSRNRIYADIYASKKFLNKHITAFIGIFDVFHSHKNGTNLHFPKIVTTQTEWKDEQRFYISFRFDFNTTKSNYKGTGAGNSEKNRM